MTTITANNGAGSTSPTAIPDLPASDESRNLTYDLIDGGMAVVLRTPRLRSGEFEAFYISAADREEARVLHREVTSFTMTEPTTDLSLTYIVGNGGIRGEQRDGAWVLRVSFQEIEL